MPVNAASLAVANYRAAASSQEQQRRVKNKISSEARLLLSEDCLSLLIALLTELPRPAGRASARSALRREVVHRLASSECTHSEIASVVVNLTDVRKGVFLGGRGEAWFDLPIDSRDVGSVFGEVANVSRNGSCGRRKNRFKIGVQNALLARWLLFFFLTTDGYKINMP